jgi:hypothetical protein
MENLNLDEKKIYSLKLLSKHPDRIPVIIEKCENYKLENYKYLLPKDITFSVFLGIIKTKMNNACNSKQAIFTFVKTVDDSYLMVPMSETIENIYSKHKQPDNFLYFKFGIENTFG